jgi:hypothetical protein
MTGVAVVVVAGDADIAVERRKEVKPELFLKR